MNRGEVCSGDEAGGDDAVGPDGISSPIESCFKRAGKGTYIL